MSRPDDEAGGFLGRWARRKQEAQRAASAPSPAAEPTPPVATGGPEADLPLPSLDSIVPGADVSAFFQAHVPDALRKAALRKLWTTDPEISGFIEMADYQWDFNNPDAIPGWGTTLDGNTVKRLARQLLGDGPEEGKHPSLAQAQAQALVEGEGKPQQNSGDAERVPSSADDAMAALPEPSGEDVAGVAASQKILDETVIYPTSRKRHGGALPS